jgi:hypothetical protein
MVEQVLTYIQFEMSASQCLFDFSQRKGYRQRLKTERDMKKDIQRDIQTEIYRQRYKDREIYVQTEDRDLYIKIFIQTDVCIQTEKYRHRVIKQKYRERDTDRQIVTQRERCT